MKNTNYILRYNPTTKFIDLWVPKKRNFMSRFFSNIGKIINEKLNRVI